MSGKYAKFFALGLFLLFLGAGCASEPGGGGGGGGSSSTPTTPDTTPPVVTIVSPTNYQEVGASYSINGTATDDKSGVKAVYVSLDDGVFSAATLAGSSWSTNISVSTYGEHTNYVYAEDNSNNISATNMVIIVRAAMPAVTITNLANGTMTNIESITVAGQASIDPPYTILSVELSLNGSAFSPVAYAGGNWSKDITLASGSNFISVIAVGNNNKTNEIKDFLVILDNVSPNVNITSPSGGEISSSNYTFSGTATDTYGIKSVYVKLDSGSFSQVNVGVGGSWSTNYNVGYGIHTNYVYAVDNAGNFSSTNSVVVEYKASPNVAITSPVNNSQTNVSTISVTGTATISSPYIIQSVEISVNGSPFAPVSVSLPNWSTNGVSLIGGTNTIIAKAVADNGKEAYATNKIVRIKKWTIMIYMNGDNNLESYAIADFNEMEGVPELTNDDVNVIVLFDRANGYDTSNGDWKGTRLYKVDYDTNGVDGTIISTRLAGMGLSATGDSDELNMGDPIVLSNFVSYANANFPAEKRMLIIWNHGDGWRSKNNFTLSKPDSKGMIINNTERLKTIISKTIGTKSKGTGIIEGIKSFIQGILPQANNSNPDDAYKAVSFDETSGNDALYNSEVRTALTGKGINVLGMDACLMGMVETAYEWRSIADYLIASPEVTPGDGWEYNIWLHNFLSSGDLTTGNLITNIISAYAGAYTSTSGATLAAYKLSEVNSLFAAFESYVTNIYDDILNPSHDLRTTNHIYQILNYVEPYYYYTPGGYYHIDLWELADKLAMSGSSALKTAIQNTVILEWHNPSGDIFTGNPNSHGMAIYFGSFDSTTNFALRTDYAYSNYTLFNQSSRWDTYLDALYFDWAVPWMYTNTTYVSNLSGTGNYHFYEFYVSSAGGVRITLDFASGRDFDLYLLDARNGNILTNSVGITTNETINYNATRIGWYIAMPYSYSGSGSYNLRLTSTGATIK